MPRLTTALGQERLQQRQPQRQQLYRCDEDAPARPRQISKISTNASSVRVKGSQIVVGYQNASLPSATLENSPLSSSVVHNTSALASQQLQIIDRIGGRTVLDEKPSPTPGTSCHNARQFGGDEQVASSPAALPIPIPASSRRAQRPSVRLENLYDKEDDRSIKDNNPLDGGHGSDHYDSTSGAQQRPRAHAKSRVNAGQTLPNQILHHRTDRSSPLCATPDRATQSTSLKRRAHFRLERGMLATTPSSAPNVSAGMKHRSGSLQSVSHPLANPTPRERLGSLPLSIQTSSSQTDSSSLSLSHLRQRRFTNSGSPSDEVPPIISTPPTSPAFYRTESPVSLRSCISGERAGNQASSRSAQSVTSQQQSRNPWDVFSSPTSSSFSSFQERHRSELASSRFSTPPSDSSPATPLTIPDGNRYFASHNAELDNSQIVDGDATQGEPEDEFFTDEENLALLEATERDSIEPASPSETSDGPVFHIRPRSIATAVPLFGKFDLSLADFCSYVDSQPSLQRAEIVSTECHAETAAAVTHRFLILEVRRRGRKVVYLRLDRRRGEGTSVFRLFATSGMTRANDRALLAANKDLLLGSGTRLESRQIFARPPVLADLGQLLHIVFEEIVNYRVWPENCWFFCSLLQQLLGDGVFVLGTLQHHGLARNIRSRVAERYQSAKALASAAV